MKPKNIVEPSGDDTEFVFFSGKGGVGKSTMSCSTATYLAEQGYNTLLVTTDPAPNLSDIYGQEIGHEVTDIENVENLRAIEVDPDKAAEEYRDEKIEPMRELLDEDEIQGMEEQLDSPCIEEIAAFDKFTDFMGETGYDVIVFDTAPTGHTLRLLELPSAWEEELSKDQATCLGPAGSMQEEQEKYSKAVETLQNDGLTHFIFVTKPDQAAVDEVQHSANELGDLGIDPQLLIFNGYLPEEVCNDPFFKDKREKEQEIIKKASKDMSDVATAEYPLQPGEITGLNLLRDVYEVVYQEKTPEIEMGERSETSEIDMETPEEAIKSLKPENGDTRYLFFTGKGGVGKTTMASASAAYLADEGLDTLVLTTDPASHLESMFGEEVSHEPSEIAENLSAARIDQEKALEDYREQVLSQVDEMFDEDSDVDPEVARQNVKEELESPCAEEMAALEKFIGYFQEESYDVVVFDTAPTGHTLRLLELPSDWKGFMDLGSVTKELNEEDDKYSEVIKKMKDPERSSFVFVTYPEYTPIMEAWRASQDLKDQVGIETSLVAANYLLPDDHGDNQFFDERRSQQNKYLHKVNEKFDTPVMKAPLKQEEPQGLEKLREFGREVIENEVK